MALYEVWTDGISGHCFKHELRLSRVFSGAIRRSAGTRIKEALKRGDAAAIAAQPLEEVGPKPLEESPGAPQPYARGSARRIRGLVLSGAVAHRCSTCRLHAALWIFGHRTSKQYSKHSAPHTSESIQPF